ncbi:hypothetical protein TL16_g02742 [Triparma laevis f. inornata]|uniref:Uncharacterized protein n=1 Tax=Triparma laevis f. inornata TaxID=1714386 RepID=A0A9W7A077_9STRA|nr:hypothetical protein TL16_g02742 [Triparma laevis f. inornata]
MWSSLLASASSTTQIGIDLPSNFGAGEESDEDHSKFSDFIKSRDIPIAVASSPQETAVEGGEEGKKGKKRLSKRERKDEKKKTKKKKIAAVASIVESVKEEEEEEKEKEEVVVDDVKEKKKKKKEKKEKKEKKSKKEKKETTSNPTTPPLPTFPYPTDSSDHCETPLIAYTHISPLLSHLSKTSPNLKIYDPYYCDGSVVNKLGNLGTNSRLGVKRG